MKHIGDGFTFQERLGNISGTGSHSHSRQENFRGKAAGEHREWNIGDEFTTQGRLNAVEKPGTDSPFGDTGDAGNRGRAHLSGKTGGYWETGIYRQDD